MVVHRAVRNLSINIISFILLLLIINYPALSDRLRTELVWPKEVKFLYGLSQGITTANPTSDIEDEKSDDD
jgi:hypothetical protein